MKTPTRSRISLYATVIFSMIWLSNLSPIASHASAQDAEEVDQFVQRELADSGIPGVAIAMVENGRITINRGYGIADSSGRPVGPDTPFQIASLSKSFTALCILQLVDEGRLDLDRPIVDYVPDFHTREREKSNQITIRHLLMHRSGITTLAGNRYQGTRYRGADALEGAVERLHKARLRSVPGQSFEYSNANYAILGRILEIIDDAPFEDIMDRRIFTPLGMDNSYVQIPRTQTVPEAHGYRNWFGFTREQPFTAGRMMAPAGGVVSSANDMGIYLAAMTDPERDLISEPLRAQMFSGEEAWNDVHYAMGWGIREDETGQFIFHEGLNPGFKSVAGFYPESRDGYVVLTNLSSSLGDNFALAVLDVAQGREPREYKASIGAIATLFGLSSLAFALSLGAIRAVIRLVRVGDTHSAFHRLTGRILCMGLLAFSLLALSFGLLIFIPAQNAMTLQSIYTFYPDLAISLGLGGCAAVLWAIAIVIGNIRRFRESKNQP